MATRAITVVPAYGNCRVATWTGLTFATTDDGQPFETGDFADSCVQIGGTFGAGGTVVFEGSNDGVTYFTLNDVQAAAISKTAAAIEQVAEAPRYVRPRVTAGDGTTSLTVVFYARRGRA
jgi:hypothetical protein